MAKTSDDLQDQDELDEQEPEKEGGQFTKAMRAARDEAAAKYNIELPETHKAIVDGFKFAEEADATVAKLNEGLAKHIAAIHDAHRKAARTWQKWIPWIIGAIVVIIALFGFVTKVLPGITTNAPSAPSTPTISAPAAPPNCPGVGVKVTDGTTLFSADGKSAGTSKGATYKNGQPAITLPNAQGFYCQVTQPGNAAAVFVKVK